MLNEWKTRAEFSMLAGDEASLLIHHNAEYLSSPADSIEHSV
jgi:hypothetical protein